MSVSCEINGASVARGVAIFLMMAFVGLIVLPAGCQMCINPGEQARFIRATLGPSGAWAPTAAALNHLAEELARVSQVAGWARRHYQLLLTAGLGEGSRKIVIGHEGFLFLHDDVELSTGTAIVRASILAQGKASAGEHPSVDAILDYEEGMRSQGVHVVVVPVPVGPMLYPKKVWPAYSETGPAWGADYVRWKERLTAAGVDVCDVTDRLWLARHEPEALWIKDDSHWSPRGVALSAEQIARHVRPWLGSYRPRHYATRPVSASVGCDLIYMLDLAGSPHCAGDLYPATQILQEDGFATADDEATVLLLGDSYSHVYTGRTAGDIPGADLGRQLMHSLGTPVQILAESGVTPAVIRKQLAERPLMLKHKKVLVWEFTVRALLYPEQWPKVTVPSR